MTRVLSGVVLGAAFFTIVWFGSTTVLLGVALLVCALAFREYAALMEKMHAAPPTLLALAATLAAVVAVPFPLVPFEIVAAVGVVGIAIAAMVGLNPGQSSSAFSEGIAATASGALAMVYLGLPL